jgi:hypothetical protein
MIKYYAAVVSLSLTVAGCGSVSKDSGGPAVRTNTLSGESFNAKVGDGKQIYQGMDSVRGKFSGGPVKSLGGLSLLTQIDNSSDIDLNDPGCSLTDSETKTFGDVSYTTETYACKLVRDSKNVECTVLRVLDQSGAELSKQHSCADAQGGDTPAPSDPTDPADPADPADQSGEVMSYLPAMTQITDCASAFDMFESLFAQSKQDYEAMAATFLNPKSHADQYTSLNSVEPASDEAVAYEMVPQKAMDGLTVKGRFAGGGTDTSVMLRNKVELTMDFSKMFSQQGGFPFPQGGEPGMEQPQPTGLQAGVHTVVVDNTFDIDLAAVVAKSSVNMTMTQVSGDITSSQNIVGTVTVSNGAEKYVVQDLAVKLAGAQDAAFTAKLTARLVDAGTLTLAGEFKGPGAPGSVNVTVQKSPSGICQVQSLAK